MHVVSHGAWRAELQSTSPVRARVARRLANVALATIFFVAAVVQSARCASAGTLVTFDFAGFGIVSVDLFDDLTPVTVPNFVQHVNAGTYTDSMVHRVDVPLGVIQGGGFGLDAMGLSPIFGPIVNESSAENRRGTIAMARGGEADSATSQWFFNTEDNQAELGNSPITGYAVFGWIVGDGMNVIDSIAAVPTFVYASPFGQIPLQNVTQEDLDGGENPLDHLVVLSSVTVANTHPSFQNPVWNVDVDNSNSLNALDPLLILNDIILHDRQPYSVEGPFSNASLYRDVSGNGTIDQLDLVLVINAIIAQDQQVLSAAALPSAALPLGKSSVAMALVVPEPASLALLAAGGLLLAGWTLARRRRRLA